MSSDESNYEQTIISSSSADAQIITSSIASLKPTELTPFSSPNFKFKSLSSFHKHYSSSSLNDESLFNVKSLPSTFHNKSKNGLPSLPTTEWSKFLKFILLERLKAPSEPPSAVKELTTQLSKEPVQNLQELLPLLSQLFDNNPLEAWLNQNFVIFTILVKNSPSYQQTLMVRLAILNIILPFLRDAKEDNIGEIISFLNVFTNEGRNVNGIEVYLFKWLFSYLGLYYQKGENLNNQSVKHILKFYGQLIKFNFSLFSPQELTKLIKLIELMTNWKELDSEGGTLLISIFDNLVRFGYLPTECISSFCSLMTNLYGITQWKLAAWGIVKNILRSHCATSVICSFFDMAYSKDQDLKIVKYSIAAIGESLWGKDRIEPQAYPTFSALKHFSNLLLDSKALPNSHVRIATILEQLNKLINTRKDSLSPGDWELIIDMLCQASYSVRELDLIELNPSLLGIESDLEFEEDSITELWFRFNQLTTTISPTLTSLHVNEIQKFIFVLKDHWDYLSEPLLLTSLGYLSSSNVFLPSRTNWDESLKNLLNKLFVTKSQLAKEAILEILERSFISCSFSNQQTFIDIFKAEIMDKLVELEEIDEGVNLKIYKLIVKFWDLNLDDFNPLFELLSKPFKSTQEIATNRQDQLANHQLYSCFILAHWFSLALIGRSKYCTRLYSILCDIASNTHIGYESRLMAYTSLFNVFTDNSNSPYFGQLSLSEEEVSQCLDLIQDCSKLPNSTLSKYWVFNGLYALDIWNNEENYSISTSVESKFANNCSPNTIKYPPSPINLASTGDFTLSTKTFLQNIINSLTDELDWSIMAYILYQTPAYLTNHLDHKNHNDSILTLRSKLCNLISSGGFGAKLVGIPNYIKKGSLYSSIYRLLDSIIPYKQLFNKSEKDEIVSHTI
ncbi:hypothetical protein CONCODRAFT_4329 [Conidiobolus coronatus NRRL 28638]|uniref:Uncharacterized protein n=1 Tax=Conidiobolus coronatus (strain ATCC 28846 / CBS 209.66 / NRRL 28638) TaxID=796925 RepID=A0A137PCW5_CONC2|nr:hypothetical protein CONCODRAFT_4329 [Conidiobolus coronatus NRRL 28638]|eukprot:KXN72830.1 hypothetical protein CONCODRAFT_4329 [Conidiobolus coronatus NRRL 28638]